MHKGYNLKIDWNNDEYYAIGKSGYDSVNKKIRIELDKYLSPYGDINGSRMQEDWFPGIDADIFISHSHKNEKLAISLAGLFSKKLGLTAFVDSCVWGFAGDLLRQIDDRYCKQSDGNYNYDSRNYSTSHVHMMLCSALSKMIHKTECLLFLNTPDSIKTSNAKDKTNSPWIYYEIGISRVIEKRLPERMRLLAKSHMAKLAEDREFAEIQYDLDHDHLIDIDRETINKWIQEYKAPEHGLDPLYRLT